MISTSVHALIKEPMTFAEIAEKLGISMRSAQRATWHLTSKGLAKRIDGRYKAVEPPRKKPSPDVAAAWLFNPVQ